jgi:hypothetical protein
MEAEPTSPIKCLDEMQSGAERTLELVREIRYVIKPMDIKNLPAVLDDFVRAAKTKDVQIVMFQITEAHRKGAPIQALEQVLRNVGIPCWLIARDVKPEKLEKIQPVVSLNGRIDYQIGISLYPYYILSQSLFKESGSYVKNFEKLATATMMGSEDEKAVEKFAAEWQKEDPEFGCDTLHISN